MRAVGRRRRRRPLVVALGRCDAASRSPSAVVACNVVAKPDKAAARAARAGTQSGAVLEFLLRHMADLLQVLAEATPSAFIGKALGTRAHQCAVIEGADRRRDTRHLPKRRAARRCPPVICYMQPASNQTRGGVDAAQCTTSEKPKLSPKCWRDLDGGLRRLAPPRRGDTPWGSVSGVANIVAVAPRSAAFDTRPGSTGAAGPSSSAAG
jgi:hypothetical protein